MSISAIIIAKDAALVVERALTSVAFSDEVILVDLDSQDETIEIAAKHHARIVSYTKEAPFVELVRNFAIAHATSDWVLVLDADEELPNDLQKQLQTIAKQTDIPMDFDRKEAFYLARRNLVCGAAMRHTGWWPDYQLRFFKNGSVSWSEKIHAQPLVHDRPVEEVLDLVAYLPATAEMAILHHNYVNVGDYIKRFNRYTDIEASQNHIDEQFYITQTDLLNAFSDEWLRRFFDKQGYLDGVRGFYLSLMQAMYQMTTRMKTWGRLDYQDKYQHTDQKQLLLALRKFEKELHYWIDDMTIRTYGSGSWWTRTLIRLERRLRL